MDYSRYFGLSTSSSRNYQSTLKSQFGLFQKPFFFFPPFSLLKFVFCFAEWLAVVIEAADFCIDFEDIEEDDYEEVKGEYEYPCPFCSEDFDLVGLCCHIDEEHPVEAKSGVINFFFCLFWFRAIRNSIFFRPSINSILLRNLKKIYVSCLVLLYTHIIYNI